MKKLLLVTTALVALAATPAQADPVSAIVSIIAAGGVAGALVQIGLGVGLSLLSTAVLGAIRGKPEVNVTFDAEMGDDKPLAFTVGDYATAGRRKYIGSWGPSTMYVTDVIEVSCLPQGLAAMWVNDEPGNILWDQTETHTERVVTGYEWKELERGGQRRVPIYAYKTITLGHPVTNLADEANRIWIRYHDGTQTAVDPLLMAVFGDDPDYPWTDEFIGKGKSYVVVTTRYDSDTLTSLPTYLWQPTPLPMYDPRKDSTAGGVGSHRWGNRATYEPSRNNAVIAYNIARGVHYGTEWIYGGKNLAAWRLPMAEWVAAMNACDAAVTLAGGGTEPAYRCGAEITVDMEPAGILEEIGRAGNMRIAEVGGRLKPLVDLPGAAVFSITDDDIIITEGQSFQPFYPVSETYNAIQATYPEPGEKWASKDAPEFIDAEATAADGGRYLPVSLNYGACPFPHQVQRLMRAQLKDYRRMRRIQFHLPPDAYGLEPGDMISWTSARNGYASKLFIVEQVQKLAGMNVSVSLREVDPGDYDWSTGYQLPTNIVPPKNPILWAQAVPGFVAEPAQILDEASKARRPAIRVSCDSDVPGVTAIRIRYRVKGGTDRVMVTQPYLPDYAWYLTDVLPDTRYEVQAMLVSTLANGSIWTDWAEVLTDPILLGQDDLDQSLQEMLAELDAWIEAGLPGFVSESWRGLQDEIRALSAQAIELASQSFTAREELRRSLTVQVGDLRARYDERIVTLADVDRAAALRIQTLEAVSTTMAATIQSLQQAMVTADQALAARIDTLTVTVGNKAEASALNALTVRVGEAEEKIESTATALTAVGVTLGGFSAEGLFRVEALATPTGALSRIGMKASATAGEGTGRTAAFYMDAMAGNKSRVVFETDAFTIANGSEAVAPFRVEDGIVYIQNLRVTGDAIVGDAVSRIAFASHLGSGPAVTAAAPTIIVLGGGTGADAPAEIFPVAYGSSARNRLIFTLSGTLFVNGAVAGSVAFAVEGQRTDAVWIALDTLTLGRTVYWTAAQNQQYIPFSFMMDDLDGDVFSTGIGGPFTKFRVRATLNAAAGVSAGFSFMNMRVEQMNK